MSARLESQPPQRAAWECDIFSVPEERGGLLFAWALGRGYELLRQRGIAGR